MLIAMFYGLFALYTFLLGWLFQIDVTNYTNPWTYVLGLIALILGFVLAFGSVLGILSLLGEFRKNKPHTNKFNHYYAKSLLRLAIHIGRIKVTVSGLNHIPEGKFVLVGNHQENYDIIILMPIFKKHPIAFIAKEPLFRAPIIGKWIKALGNVPIGKEADRAAAMSMVTAIKRYKAGSPMGIFPEGKRSRSNEMIDFKPGALKLAMKPKADILVVTLHNITSIFKKFPWKRYDIKVHIHPILPYESYKDLNTIDLAAQIKSTIQTQLDIFDEAKR